MTDTMTILIILGVVLVLVALFWLLRGRRQAVTLERTGEAEPSVRRTFEPVAKPLPTPAPPPPAPPAPPAGDEGQGVADEAAAAIENIVGEFLGVDAHHDRALDGDPAAPDALVTIKGLGPKAAALLNAEGITRFDQLAALTPDQAAALDARMGSFQGRIARDKWIEQARLLAAHDRAGFEAAFGRIG